MADALTYRSNGSAAANEASRVFIMSIIGPHWLHCMDKNTETVFIVFVSQKKEVLNYIYFGENLMPIFSFNEMIIDLFMNWSAKVHNFKWDCSSLS